MRKNEKKSIISNIHYGNAVCWVLMIGWSHPCGLQWPSMHILDTNDLERAARLLIRLMLYMIFVELRLDRAKQRPCRQVLAPHSSSVCFIILTLTHSPENKSSSRNSVFHCKNLWSDPCSKESTKNIFQALPMNLRIKLVQCSWWQIGMMQIEVFFS